MKKYILGLSLLAAANAWLGVKIFEGEQKQAALLIQINTRDEIIEKLHVENLRLKNESAASSISAAAPSSKPQSPPKVSLPNLPPKFPRGISLDSKFHLTNEFAVFANLPAEQTKALDKILDATVSVIQELKFSRTSGKIINENMAQVVYSANANEIEIAIQEFRKNVRDVIANESREMFFEIVERDLAHRLNSFGEASMTYDIERATAPSGIIVYKTRIQEAVVRDPTKTRVSIFNTYTREQFLSNVPLAASLGI